jgi:hypothetical protein
MYIHEILIHKAAEWIMLSLTNPHLTTSTLKIHFNNNLSPTAGHPHLTCTKLHCEIWSSHSSDNTEYCLLGLMCRAIQIYQHFKQTYCIHPQGRAQAGSSRLFQNCTFLTAWPWMPQESVLKQHFTCVFCLSQPTGSNYCNDVNRRTQNQYLVRVQKHSLPYFSSGTWTS